MRPCRLSFSLAARLAVALAVALVCLWPAAALAAGFNNRHVMLIGIDGCRPEALQAASAPNLKTLATNGSVTWDAVAGGYARMVTDQRTDRGPGWASVLTGTWVNSHHVTNDTCVGFVPGQTPHFFGRLKQASSTAWLASIVEWAPIDTTFVAPLGASVDFHQTALDGDTTDAVAKVSDLLSYQAPDVVVVALGEPGFAGQASGFSPLAPEYLNAIAHVDAGVGALVQAVRSRPSYGTEDWLFVVVGVSSGDPDGQVGLTAAERSTFIIVSGNSAARQVVSAGPGITCVPSTVYTFLTGNAPPTSYNWDPATFGLEPQAITNKLAVYLNFDNTLAASGGTTISATVYSGTPKYTAGILGQAAHFTNTSGTVQPVDWAASLGIQDSLYAGNFSVSVWTRMATNIDGALVGNKDWNSGYNRGWVINQEFLKQVNWGDGSYRRDVDLAAATDGGWHHIAFSFDRAGGIARTYFDGVLKDVAAPGGSLAAGLKTMIGASGNGTYAGKGDVDELAIWTRAISGPEVADLYAKALLGLPLTTPYTAPPTITRQPVSRVVGLGQSVRFQAAAAGSSPVYQWRLNDVDLASANGPMLCITNITAADAGTYTVVVTNFGGSVTSAPAMLTVTPFLGGVNFTNGLVAHLSFDGNFKDSSGNGYDGAPVGTPTLVRGLMGNAMRFDSRKDGTSFNYVTLGTNIVREIATNDFTLAFWYRHRNTNLTSEIDPPIVSNKNWDSGYNNGFVFAEQPGGGSVFNIAVNNRMDVSAGRIGDGGWHHIAITCARKGNLVVYKDGLPVATQPTTIATTSVSIYSGFALNLGQDGRGIYTYGNKVGITNALMDDFGLWRRALTAGEIALVHAEATDGRSFEQQSPVIVMQPHSISARVHMGHVLLAMAAGAPPLSFQWVKDGQPLPGWTNTWWSFKDFSTNDSGTYAMVVSNRFGTATSTPAVISISTNEWGYAPIVLQDASYTINTNDTLVIATNDVLNLAQNFFGDWLGYTLDAPVSLLGSPVSLLPNGSITYTPPAGLMGQDWFFVNFTDPHGGANASVITVNITNGLIPHVTAHNTNLVATSWQMLGLSVPQILSLAHDPLGEPITYYLNRVTTQSQQPVWLSAFGTITYYPTLVVGTEGVPFLGNDQFEITFRDARGGIAVATVFVNVQAQGGGGSGGNGGVPPQVVVHTPNTPAHAAFGADFTGGANLVYIVEWAPTLDGPWTFMYQLLSAPDGLLPNDFPIDRSVPSRFFRIRLAPPEGSEG